MKRGQQHRLSVQKATFYFSASLKSCHPRSLHVPPLWAPGLPGPLRTEHPQSHALSDPECAQVGSAWPLSRPQSSRRAVP